MTDWDRVRRLTFVLFVDDGRCALIPDGDRLLLPGGEVLPGEDPLLDTCLRVPLATPGFRRQSLHELEADGDHLAVWCEGDDGYCGRRPHARVSLWKGEAAEAASRLRATGDHPAAVLVEAADRARRDLDEQDFYRDGLRLTEASYLRERTPQGGSAEVLRHQPGPAGGTRRAPARRQLRPPPEQRDRHPAAVLERLGFRVDGVTGPGNNGGRAVPPTAWVRASGAGS
jgi:hypothetical protein